MTNDECDPLSDGYILANDEKWLKLWEKHLMMTSLESHVHKNILERIKEIHYAAYMIGKADRGDEILKQLRGR